MNNDKINRLKDAYFSGESSENDEKWLKENADDPFFNVLKEEKEQQMEWNFDQFLAMTETKQPVKKSGVFFFTKPFFRVAATVAVLISGTLLYIQTNDTDVRQTQLSQLEDNTETEKTKTIPDVVPSEKITGETAEPIVRTTPNRRSESPKKTRRSPESQPAYNPEYVVINGKPVYDLEEAKELTMNSLNLLASNVEKSVSSMENVKYLSIKF